MLRFIFCSVFMLGATGLCHGIDSSEPNHFDTRFDPFLERYVERELFYWKRECYYDEILPDFESLMNSTDYFKWDVSHLVALMFYSWYLRKYSLHRLTKIDIGKKMLLILERYIDANPPSLYAAHAIKKALKVLEKVDLNEGQQKYIKNVSAHLEAVIRTQKTPFSQKVTGFFRR